MNKLKNKLLIKVLTALLFAVSTFNYVHASPPSSFECLASAQAFNHLIPESNKAIPIGEHSIAANIDDFENFFVDVYEMTPTRYNFIKSYEKQFSKSPTVKDAVAYVDNVSSGMANNLREFGARHKEAEQFSEIAARAMDYSDSKRQKVASTYLKDYRTILDEIFDPENERHTEFFIKLKTDYYGTLGEYDIALRLDHVLGVGIELGKKPKEDHDAFRFFQTYKNRLSKVTAELKDQMTDKKLEELNHEFPHIFKNNDELSPEEALDKALTWIETKEIDVITQLSDGKYALVEVKNYGRVMERRTIVDKHGSKSILDQQIEMKEIISLLGLEDLFIPYIAIRNGMTQKAKDALEEAGIKVLGPIFKGN